MSDSLDTVGQASTKMEELIVCPSWEDSSLHGWAIDLGLESLLPAQLVKSLSLFLNDLKIYLGLFIWFKAYTDDD